MMVAQQLPWQQSWQSQSQDVAHQSHQATSASPSLTTAYPFSQNHGLAPHAGTAQNQSSQAEITDSPRIHISSSSGYAGLTAPEMFEPHMQTESWDRTTQHSSSQPFGILVSSPVQSETDFVSFGASLAPLPSGSRRNSTSLMTSATARPQDNLHRHSFHRASPHMSLSQSSWPILGQQPGTSSISFSPGFEMTSAMLPHSEMPVPTMTSSSTPTSPWTQSGGSNSTTSQPITGGLVTSLGLSQNVGVTHHGLMSTTFGFSPPTMNAAGSSVDAASTRQALQSVEAKYRFPISSNNVLDELSADLSGKRKDIDTIDDLSLNVDGEDDLSADWGDESPTKKGKAPRRQGVTCDECRVKHLRCDLADKIAEARRRDSSGLATSAPEDYSGAKPEPKAICARCQERGLTCNKTINPPSRRYPRPSRTGKRIEQARSMHGSVTSSQADQSSIVSTDTEIGMPSAHTDTRLSGAIVAGALSLRLLSCFFNTAHTQIPVVDFASFTSRYNAAQGNPKVMSIMLNGGDASQGIPSMTMSFPGLKVDRWPDTLESTISTPGTSEALIAAMHAWAAHYTDAPVAFGGEQKAHALGVMEANRSNSPVQLDPMDSFDTEPDYSHLPPSKRPKRKQGVACDTCRLRRVRCDLMERKSGGPCSRCQDKRIVCTDEYIQLKKRKNEAKLRKEQEKQRKGLVTDDNARSRGSSSPSTDSNWNQLGSNPDPLAWTPAPSLPNLYVGSKTVSSLTQFGRARQAFCHDMLTRAVLLVHKHQLLQKPSVEAVQALVLLIQLFDLLDSTFASEMTLAASSHLRLLGLQSSEEIDETDRRAVEKLFNQMQEKRVWCSTWTRDAIAACIYRRLPNFDEERAIRTIGKRFSHATSPTAAPELTPEMGLSFSVMALMQQGVLARFVAKHIDGINRPVLLPPQQRFPMLPSAADISKLTKAVHAVWKSNDALNAFFDRCTLKAWTQMEALKIFRPKAWIASVKTTSAMLNLSVYRILGERHRINAAYLQAVSQTHGSHVISADDLAQSQALRELFEMSSQRAFISCRKVARLVEKLLAKPSLTFQTGGILLRQLFAVAQFLARTPSEDSNNWPQPSAVDPAAIASGAAWTQSDSDVWSASNSSFFAGLGSSSSQQSQQHQQQLLVGAGGSIDPQALNISFIPTVQPEPPPSPSELVHLAMGYDDPLAPYDASAKVREVNCCLEALDQLGFAWPMESEIESVRGILRGDLMRRMSTAV